MARHAHLDRIEDEASLWAARLDGGGMTDADRATLEAWLEADPEHRWVLSRYRQLSSQLDEQLAPAAESVAILETAARRRRWRVASAIAAAAAIIAVLFVVLSGRPTQFVTKTAERHVALLDDGSRIELNAETKLAVALRDHERRVKFERGEALFTVAKDSARPFFVETAAGVVRVTGTVFNVRSVRGERAEVTVLEGSVRVRPAQSTVEESALTPGRRAIVEPASVQVSNLDSGAVEDLVAWRGGVATFNNTPLAEAIERYQAYHARRITVDPAVASLAVGGRYSLEDLDGFLDSIRQIHPIKIVPGGANGVRIVPATAR